MAVAKLKNRYHPPLELGVHVYVKAVPEGEHHQMIGTTLRITIMSYMSILSLLPSYRTTFIPFMYVLFYFILLDCEPPVIATVNVLTLTDPGTSSASSTWNTPTATDIVDPTVTVIQQTSFMQGDRFPLGTTYVMYSAIDEAGNTAMANLLITVIGNDICSY